jgi:hypothetical protein
MTNDGSIGVSHIRVKGENLDDEGLANAVLITKLVYTEGGNEYDITSWFINLIDTWTGIGNNDGKASLTEFISWCGVKSLIFFEGGWPPTTPYLEPDRGNVQHLILGFTFDPEAENEFQDTSASFDLTIFAYQSPEQYPPEWWTTPSHGY